MRRIGLGKRLDPIRATTGTTISTHNDSDNTTVRAGRSNAAVKSI